MVDNLEAEYRKRHASVPTPVAKNLEGYLKDVVGSRYHRIDRIVARAKSVDRFLEKAAKSEGGTPKYPDPLNQIQDQIGARVVTYYLSDVEPIAQIIKDYFAPIEERRIVPDSVNEFGYEGKHFILFIPDDVVTEGIPHPLCPTFFEMQVKTLFQHAWGEANHDLAYKPHTPISVEQRRMIAFTAAQAWGADRIFNDLAAELIGRATT